MVMTAKAWHWLVKEQVRSLPEGDWKHWRQAIQGGWGFSHDLRGTNGMW